MVEGMITALLTGVIMSLVYSGVALLKAKLFRKKGGEKTDEPDKPREQ